MRTPANIAGHPIHPMLVTIPIGLWVFSLVCDLIALRSGAPQTWNTVAFYSMVGGVVGALAAAVPGLIDLLSLGGSPVKKTAIAHMSINLAVVALFAVNAWTRYQASVSHNVSLALSVLAIAMLLVSGWLGGKMVYQAGVGVDTEQAAATARSGGWRSDADTSWNRQPTMAGGPGRRGERAMATDSMGPLRDETREERAAAGRTGAGDTPRE
jgi:uncharacterized membrane protein